MAKRKNFTRLDKCYIYRREAGICFFAKEKILGLKKKRICKDYEPIKWHKKKLCFHHKIHVEDHGKTIVSNGFPAHRECHIEWHKVKPDKKERIDTV